MKATPAERAFTRFLTLDSLPVGPSTHRVVADEAERAAVARELGVLDLTRLEAAIVLQPAADRGGLRLNGTVEADLVQTCVVSLERVPATLCLSVVRRYVVGASPLEEALVDPEAEDPPDSLEDRRIDLAAVMVEAVALEMEPYPRAPGSEFGGHQNSAENGAPAGPFAVLADRNRGKPDP